jgi:hypothetical protein
MEVFALEKTPVTEWRERVALMGLAAVAWSTQKALPYALVELIVHLVAVQRLPSVTGIKSAFPFPVPVVAISVALLKACVLVCALDVAVASTKLHAPRHLKPQHGLLTTRFLKVACTPSPNYHQAGTFAPTRGNVPFSDALFLALYALARFHHDDSH